MNKGSDIYPRHRLHTLEPYYSRHVAAMTELPGKQEGLHAKSDIAAQLAWRDQAIEALRTQLKAAEAGLHRAWVPCAERMPPTGWSVLVAGGCAYFNGIEWRTLMGASHRVIEWAVTHWMPLPEPPEVNHVDG